jgi:hypothetical protein
MSHTPEGRSMYMVGLKGLRSVIFFAEVFLLSGSFVWAGEVVISKVSDPSGSFCHLKFPAIRDDTLFSDRPVLKDPSEGDIIDFYGPCNYDPLGRDSIPSPTVRTSAPYAQRVRARLKVGSESAPGSA